MIPQVNAETPHPEALPVRPEGIPAELKAVDAWVMWRYKLGKDKKWTKPLYRLDNQGLASSTDPATWGSFPEALKRYSRGRYDGIGFVLHNGSEISGIDLDHCCHDGEIKPWALKIIEEVNSYTEISPSGTGIRIFVKAMLPPGGRKKGHIEIYDRVRYLTTTGHHLSGTPQTIETRYEAIDALHASVFERLDPKLSNPILRDGHSLCLDDDTLLHKAFSAKNGDKIRALYNGDYDDRNRRGVRLR